MTANTGKKIPISDDSGADPIPSSGASVDANAEPATSGSAAGDQQAIIAEAEEVVAQIMDEVESEAEAANDELAEAKKQAADWQDKYLRLHAEWDTYRRRTNEQREAEKVRATEKLMGELLPVLDDFERTIDYAQKNGETGLLSGVQAVQAKLLDTLGRGGLETIDPAGEAYDALEAQAVATVDDPSVPDETVAQVYQKGYKMGKKVLRPAMVTIATGGPKRTNDEGEES